jgi:hypothetical protein
MSKEARGPFVPALPAESNLNELDEVLNSTAPLGELMSGPFSSDSIRFLEKPAHITARKSEDIAHYRIDFPGTHIYGGRFADLLNHSTPQRSKIIEMQSIGSIITHWQLVSSPAYSEVIERHSGFGEYWDEAVSHLPAFMKALSCPTPEHLRRVAEIALQRGTSGLIEDDGQFFESEVVRVGSNFAVKIGDARFLFSRRGGEMCEKKRYAIQDPPFALHPVIEWAKKGDKRYTINTKNPDNFTGLILLSYLTPEVNEDMPQYGSLRKGDSTAPTIAHTVPALASIYRQRLLNGSFCQSIERLVTQGS